MVEDNVFVEIYTHTTTVPRGLRLPPAVCVVLYNCSSQLIKLSKTRVVTPRPVLNVSYCCFDTWLH